MPLFKRFRAPKPTFQGHPQPDTPFFAVGDLHGRADLLARQIDHMAAIDSTLTCVFLGDFIDRGDDSAEVLRQLHARQRAAPEQVICLLGNHEDMLLKFLDQPERHGDRWMRYGGLQTLASFRVAPPRGARPEAEDWILCRDRLLAAMGPELPAWLAALPTRWNSGNVHVVHAAADPALPMDHQTRQTLLWGHPDFETTPRQDGQWVVHGHVIQDEPRVGEGRISIDTGAYATGVLSAALITPGKVHVYST